MAYPAEGGGGPGAGSLDERCRNRSRCRHYNGICRLGAVVEIDQPAVLVGRNGEHALVCPDAVGQALDKRFDQVCHTGRMGVEDGCGRVGSGRCNAEGRQQPVVAACRPEELRCH